MGTNNLIVLDKSNLGTGHKITARDYTTTNKIMVFKYLKLEKITFYYKKKTFSIICDGP